MAQTIILPQLGQTVEEAAIVKWHKKTGDQIKKGDVLFEIETDKAVLEVESFYDGTLLKIIVEENVVVPVSSVVAYIGDKGEQVPDAPPPPAAAPKPEPTPAPKPEATQEKQPEAAAPAATPAPTPATPAPATPRAPVAAPPAETKRLFISPRAKALAKKSLVNPSRITGTGPNGRIVIKDVEAYLKACEHARIRISPAARRLAAEEEIDVLSVKGTGTAGRVMVSDIETAIAEKPQTLSKMRQVIASRLTQSFTTTPHFYVSVDVDMTDLLTWRQELKDTGKTYSVTVFVLEAVILSLKEFPMLNSVTDGKSVSWNSRVQLGMAVGLDDGLVVPVIPDAEALELSELQSISKDLASRARDGKLLPDEMTGSTFTVSNMGMLGVDSFKAIINPGESGILAIASTREKPVVIDGAITIRSIMNITLSTDHRIVDGAMGAAFVNAIKDKLEDSELWKTLT